MPKTPPQSPSDQSAPKRKRSPVVSMEDLVEGRQKQKSWVQRFWENVRKAGPDECWNWTGTPSEYGYGRLSVKNRPRLVHRLSFLIANGRINPDLLVMHSCDNKLCVNPKHLHQGTVADNIHEATERGLMPRGVRHGNSKLSDHDVEKIRQMARVPGVSYGKIAAQFSIQKPHVCRIVNHKARARLSN